LWILFLKAEKYGQFTDSTVRVSTQEREKQKGVEKKQIRETKYYKQGMAIANHLAASSMASVEAVPKHLTSEEWTRDWEMPA